MIDSTTIFLNPSGIDIDNDYTVSTNNQDKPISTGAGHQRNFRYKFHLWHHDMEIPSSLLALCEGNYIHQTNYVLVGSGGWQTHWFVCQWQVGLHELITSIFPPSLYPLDSTKLKEGYTGFTLSLCPSVCLSVCLSVDRIVSALYLQQYLPDTFHICTSYQATSGVLHVTFVSKLKIFKIWQIL